MFSDAQYLMRAGTAESSCFGNLVFRRIILNRIYRGLILQFIPGSLILFYYTKEQASNFDEVFGTNTGYTIDPEECMADNFADAMQYGLEGKNGQGYPNPEIILGVIDIVSK